ncbi:histidine kinase dimerization/phosphoacceptor domain -containing protein [Methylocystis sp. 9N]|uniref:histidine kinase n=1 Tax=Methylocystis borbori TaxID=3118750 RepID=A0ABU7XDV4_9HYPH
MAWAGKIARISNQKTGLTAWAATLALFALSLAIRFAFSPVFEGIKFLTFYPAVAAAGLLYGWPHGLVVLLLSTLAAWYWFMEPFDSFALNRSTTIAQLLGFIFVAGFILVLVAALRGAVHRLEYAKKVQETLFQDLQHRVANNLQLVVSLLRIAQRNLQDPIRAAETLDQAEARIMAMSQLHRHLNDGTAFANGLEPALREMLQNSFKDLPVTVRLELEGAGDLSIEQMTAVALLVNEAAMNSVKYAFSRGLGSVFSVTLCQNPGRGQLRLLIEDDGPGIVSLNDSKEQPSLGMKIMEAFATQLGGALEIIPGGGTRLSVEIHTR